MEEFSFTDKELERIHIIRNVDEGRLTQAKAAEILERSTRQVGRLLKQYREEGIMGLVSKKKGKGSNRAYPSTLRDKVIEIIKKDFYDYGPTLVSEKLLEYENIDICKETARQWMIAEGLWTAHRKTEPKVHQSRPRRPCLGELIQIDGSDHEWLENGRRYSLLVFIDDATSEIMELKMVEAETTLGYFASLKRYILRHGIPKAVYTDKHVVFKMNQKGSVSGTGLTQFGRALHQLGIKPFFAHSPEAKGRVERCNRTLQDRLIKELRYHNKRTIHEANDYLDEYRIKHNRQFARPPNDFTNLHRPLSNHEKKRLDNICSHQERRKVTKNLQVKYYNVTYQLEVPGKGHRLRQAGVTVCLNEFGKITILYKNKSIPYSVYNEHQYKDKTAYCRKEIDRLVGHFHWCIHSKLYQRWYKPSKGPQ